MAQRNEILAVYTAGLIQGIGLVTFPAASAVFTSPHAYGLSTTQYGGLFVPQAILAIVASLAGAGLRSRVGTKRIYVVGLFANLLAMSLLVLSRFVMQNHSLAYGILLMSTAFMGIGFGLTVPALNTFAAAFFPKTIDKAVLALNALLGLGTALAPVFIAIFVGLGIWWGLPVLVGALLLVMLFFSFTLPLHEGAPTKSHQTQKATFPARFWIFAVFVLLYGICETMNGNWASLYMTSHFGASATIASIALALFWAMVTVGRVLFAALAEWLPERWVFRILPLVVASAFLVSAWIPKTTTTLGLLVFALAGLGCSALLPLVISFGQKELAAITASVAGGLIGFYQIGYGLAAFGVGPLQTWAGLHLTVIYSGTAIVALTMFALSFVVTHHTVAPTRPSSGIDAGG